MVLMISVMSSVAGGGAAATPRSSQERASGLPDGKEFDDEDENEEGFGGLELLAGALEAVTPKKKKKESQKVMRRDHVPMKKKGARAFENAAREVPVSRTSLGQGELEVPLRLLVHAVQDDTNKGYLKEVEPFLESVRLRRLPFSTPSERDITVAAELDNRCFVERTPLSSGTRLYHGLCHVFPEWKSDLPISLRALHSWEKFQETWEGGPASIEAIYFVAARAIKKDMLMKESPFLWHTIVTFENKTGFS